MLKNILRSLAPSLSNCLHPSAYMRIQTENGLKGIPKSCYREKIKRTEASAHETQPFFLLHLAHRNNPNMHESPKDSLKHAQ